MRVKIKSSKTAPRLSSDPLRHAVYGLTLIEILIALALLGILTAFVVSSLAGSLQITRENRRTLDATTNAQRILEDIRGQWARRATFNSGCANTTLVPPGAGFMAVSVTQQSLDAKANPTNTASAVAFPCGTLVTAANCVTPMKRVIVLATDAIATTKVLSRVTLDILCGAP